MAQFYDKVLRVLKKAPEERISDEIRSLEPWFRKRSNILESLSSGMSNLCSLLFHVFFYRYFLHE